MLSLKVCIVCMCSSDQFLLHNLLNVHILSKYHVYSLHFVFLTCAVRLISLFPVQQLSKLGETCSVGQILLLLPLLFYLFHI